MLTRLSAKFILFSFLLASAFAAHAERDAGEAGVNVNLEVSMGREDYTAPLVRFDDQGPVLSVAGRTHLGGEYRHFGVSAVRAVPFGDNAEIQLSGSLLDRRFASAPDLDFAMQGGDVIFRRQLGDGDSLGVGPSLQRLSTGGQHFRERQALQTDWTRVATGGYTSVVLEVGRNKHAADFRGFDALASIGLVRRQWRDPLPGIDDFSVELGIVRESNRAGMPDLSSRQRYFRLSSEFRFVGLQWTLGHAVQGSTFDAPGMAGLPVRRDRLTSIDLSAAYAVDDRVSLRLSLAEFRNRSNVVFYETDFAGTSLSVLVAF